MIPRSMPKRAIITEIECANFSKINGFKASYGSQCTGDHQIKHFDACSNFLCRTFRRYASYKFSLTMKKMMMMIMNNQMKTPKL